MKRKITDAVISRKIQKNAETLSDVNYSPLELVGMFQELLDDYSLILESVQGGGPGVRQRDENEDAEEVLGKLREVFTKERLHDHISNLGEVLIFAQICQDFKFICDNTVTR